ncbi:MAG TPA: hypothetical protein DEP45_02345, partial [Armatimonadetes bacterium]|nr:hypothetical protein [Armatimonadota bacterium]
MGHMRRDPHRPVMLARAPEAVVDRVEDRARRPAFTIGAAPRDALEVVRPRCAAQFLREVRRARRAEHPQPAAELRHLRVAVIERRGQQRNLPPLAQIARCHHADLPVEAPVRGGAAEADVVAPAEEADVGERVVPPVLVDRPEPLDALAHASEPLSLRCRQTAAVSADSSSWRARYLPREQWGGVGGLRGCVDGMGDLPRDRENVLAYGGRPLQWAVEPHTGVPPHVGKGAVSMKRGFTLIELLVVIAIIAILA